MSNWISIHFGYIKFIEINILCFVSNKWKVIQSFITRFIIYFLSEYESAYTLPVTCLLWSSCFGSAILNCSLMSMLAFSLASSYLIVVEVVLLCHFDALFSWNGCIVVFIEHKNQFESKLLYSTIKAEQRDQWRY